MLGDTWVFPTEQGSEIAEVIDRRRPIPAPPQPPRRIPGHQELRDASGRMIMHHRRDINLGIAQAVRALDDVRPTDRPAAQAALRESCDQAITTLIRESDLMAPASRLTMRRDAARIQRLRDRYCGPVDAS